MKSRGKNKCYVGNNNEDREIYSSDYEPYRLYNPM